jgi:hypothetical protein
MKKALVCCLILASLYGCSVGMAMSGKPDPNLGAIKEKVKRGEVELILGGAPIKYMSMSNGKLLCVYKYETGNAPSTGRAIFHILMDMVTIGLWELIATPVEGFTGNTEYVSIVYDDDDRVVEVKPSKIP